MVKKSPEKLVENFREQLDKFQQMTLLELKKIEIFSEWAINEVKRHYEEEFKKVRYFYKDKYDCKVYEMRRMVEKSKSYHEIGMKPRKISTLIGQVSLKDFSDEVSKEPTKESNHFKPAVTK